MVSTWDWSMADPLLDPLALKSNMADLLPATAESLKRASVPTQEVVSTVPSPWGVGRRLVSELVPLLLPSQVP